MHLHSNHHQVAMYYDPIGTAIGFIREGRKVPWDLEIELKRLGVSIDTLVRENIEGTEDSHEQV